MARREFTILATRCADAPLEAPKCEKPGYPSPKAWKIATITPTSRSGVGGSWINFSKGRSHGKHQNLVARGGRGHLGSGGSSAPGYQRRYVDAAAAPPASRVTGLPDFSGLVADNGAAVVNISVVEKTQKLGTTPDEGDDDSMSQF